MKTKAAPAEELEYLRRRVGEQERTLAERDRQVASYRQELSCLAQAFGPARIRVWRWAVDTRLTQYLPTHADALDSRGEPVGTAALEEERLLTAIHPDDRQQLASVWDRAYTEHTPYETEYRVVFTDGEVRHNHEIGRPEFDESGRYLGHFGTTQDITDRKQAEEAVREAYNELELRVAEQTRDLEETSETLKREIAERILAAESLRQKSRSSDLLRRIAVVANEAPDANQAMKVCLDEVCAYTGWPVGHVYEPAEDGSGELRPAKLWHLDDPERFEVLRQVTETTRFAPGIGLPGRVLASGNPAWISDVTKDANFLRAKIAGDIGVKAGMAFPVLVGTEVAAVLEFFSENACEPDPNILETMAQVGTQFGRAIERKRAEGALRDSHARLIDALESISEGFLLYDADERLVLSNSRYRKLYPEIADLLVPGVRLEDFLRAAAKRGQVAAAVGNNEEWVRKRLHQYRTAEGVVEQQLSDGRWMLGSERRTQDGGIVSIRTDITERKRAQQALLASEQALQERVGDLEKAHRNLESQAETLTQLADDLLVARDEARAADRAKSEFLAAMSHELRTPLNAIIGFSEIIKDEVFGPVGSVGYREYSKDIHESGQHLLGLINDILDLSKIESGKDVLHEENINVAKIIHSALKLMGHRAEDGGIKLELELPDQLPALRADERKLKQILVNLISNAVKFTDRGGGVTLRAWYRMDSGYVFQIVDTGIGIAPEDIPKALLRFGQVDGDLNRRYEGTGLGLPLTKALVEQHGGTLDLQSEVSVGTTVTVRFPAQRIAISPANADSLDVEGRAAS